MALIKTIQEVRAILPHLSRLSNTASLPNVDKSGRKHIVPVIGQALYDTLNAHYNAAPATLTSAEQALLPLVQLPLIAFAYLDDIGLIHATITDSGIRRASTTEMPAAFRWEVEQLKSTLADYAADGIELLIGYLYDNQADFPAWTDSDAFAQIDGLLIKTAEDFNRQYRLYQPYRTFWLLKAIMTDVEENYLANLLGRDLVAWIKAQEAIPVDTGSGEADIKKLLKKAVAFLTIRHACDQLPIRIDQYGFTISYQSGDTENPAVAGRGAAPASDIEQKKNAAERDGQNYLAKAADLLVAMAGGEAGDPPDGFQEAFQNSPLHVPVDSTPQTNGNEYRKIFRF